MHANCTLCAKNTRASAYRWIGEKHWIPGIHGANWLGGDLELVLDALEPGDEVELDYRGSVADAPRIMLHRSLDGTIIAQGPDGWRDAPGRTRWSWPPSEQPADRRERIVYELLSFLRERRGAGGLIIIPPARGVSQ